ncbi:MAG: glutamate 5-kinase [Magnetococcales bacterium]|nr:glutamate 5-kinase [Magnetococcales bacterium]
MKKLWREQWQRVHSARRVVVKIGSNLLMDAGQGLRCDWIHRRVAEMVQLIKAGTQVVIVTSGAVAAGAPRLKLGEGRYPVTLGEKQAAAAAGQGVLMRCYEEALAEHGLASAQILLTRDDMANRRRYLNARNTLETLLEAGLVPVVNENDTVMTEELRFGDNDTLGALVASVVDAEVLILLSDVEGLFDGDPRNNPEARLIPFVGEVTEEMEGLAGGTGSKMGSGGMVTKLRAARAAARCGCITVLTSGFQEGAITQVMGGGGLGTLFLAQGDPISSRRRWIVNGLAIEGVLVLDDGAVQALLKGKSLLATGILDIQGTFDRGAAVVCENRHGEKIAQGLANYSEPHLKAILGRHSREFADILGFVSSEEVIHRDHMVMLHTRVEEGADRSRLRGALDLEATLSA